MADKSANNVTEEERIALAHRLDKELDEYIANLERKPYTDGWKPEQWDKEMDKHPFFMKEVPESGEISSPLVEGLQQLKYSPEENTPEELALAYKEDGNFNFNCKQYRKAIISYTEGLKLNFNNPHLKAQLYNNRAAAHMFLENYRSCYNDCKLAVEQMPDYMKAKKRLAQACIGLNRFDECIEICDSLLLTSNDNDVLKYKQEALKGKKIVERNRRKKQAMQKVEASEDNKLKQMIEERGIKFYSEPFWKKPESEVPHKVHFEDNNLIWPVALLYPEYKTSDIIENFHEDSTFEEQLSEVFDEFPEWDAEHKYSVESIIIHYEDMNGKIHHVDKSSTLRSVLSEPDFRIDGCSPVFIIHAKGSLAYEAFLKHYE